MERALWKFSFPSICDSSQKSSFRLHYANWKRALFSTGYFINSLFVLRAHALLFTLACIFRFFSFYAFEVAWEIEQSAGSGGSREKYGDSSVAIWDLRFMVFAVLMATACAPHGPQCVRHKVTAPLPSFFQVGSLGFLSCLSYWQVIFNIILINPLNFLLHWA